MYGFAAVDRQLPCLADRGLRDMWGKWNLDARRRVATLRFTERFEEAEAATFLADLLASPATAGCFSLVGSRGEEVALPRGITAVTATPLRVGVTSMDFFDRLEGAGVWGAEEAYIRKQMDEVIDGVTVADALRDVLLNPESEVGADLWTASERDELLFRLFKMVVTGGAMSQFEDTGAPYLEATKALYKDLVAVGREAASGRIMVQSHVYAITGATGPRGAPVALFPHTNPHSLFLASIDPARRLVTLFYHAWVPYW